MLNIIKSLLLLSVLCASIPLITHAQPDPDRWDASWISHPTASATDYGVFHFRKVFSIGKEKQVIQSRSPNSLDLYEASVIKRPVIVRVSADQRYMLYVNGKEVSRGPARGDLLHWRYERIDIQKYLKQGENVIAATVWNFGEHTPVAQMSLGTGFIMEVLNSDRQTKDDANSMASEFQYSFLKQEINTNASWQVLRNPAYTPEVATELMQQTYAVVGPGDNVDGANYPWGWKTGAEDSTRFTWVSARSTSSGQAAERKGKGYGVGTDGGRQLVRREIPSMLTYEHPWGRIRKSKGIITANDRNYLSTFAVPPNTTASVLLESDEMLNAYPQLTTSRGSGSRIQVMYQEALIDSLGQKGNRSEIEGKTMLGHRDVYLPSGQEYETFEPLWYRAYRYVQLDISTGNDTLFVGGMRARETRYPFEEKAKIAVADESQKWIEDVWKVGWRTAKLCAHETYMDCPYYEQLQYVGDTRIQALISLYVSGDDRLMRRAIRDFDQSRQYFGLTQSRYPSKNLQVIPPYSLFWNAMVYDYALHRNDPGFVKEMLPGMRDVLEWYEARMNRYGLLERTEWWNFVDWTEEWPWDNVLREGGVPSQDEEGNSLLLTLQYAYALRLSQEVFAWQPNEESQAFAKTLHARRMRILDTIKTLRNSETGLFPDLRGGSEYSQHTQIMAVLAGLDTPSFLSKAEQKVLIEKTLERDDLIQATFYYKFYLFEAMHVVGLGDRYLDELQSWRDMLALDLNTFAEKPEETRSDCHAWSASPNYHLLSLVAGVRPASPAFREVVIRPALGDLREFNATIAHRKGLIEVDYSCFGESGLTATITLPDMVSGSIHWKGKQELLTPGKQTVNFK